MGCVEYNVSVSLRAASQDDSTTENHQCMS